MARSKDRIRCVKLHQQAEGYLELGLPQKALDVLSRLEGPDAADPQTLYYQGEALRALERFTEAIVPLTKVAAAEPENIHVWLALGWCHKRTGRVDLAIEALETALAADGDEPLLRYNLACYWSVAGDKQKALRYLEQALALDANYRLLVAHEPDFDSIRSFPDFQALVQGAQPQG